MNGEEHKARIVEALRKEFARAGRGSISRVERELRLYPGFFRKARRSGSLTVLTLIETLAVLEVEPGDFFARAFSNGLKERKR